MKLMKWVILFSAFALLVGCSAAYRETHRTHKVQQIPANFHTNDSVWWLWLLSQENRNSYYSEAYYYDHPSARPKPAPKTLAEEREIEFPEIVLPEKTLAEEEETENAKPEVATEKTLAEEEQIMEEPAADPVETMDAPDATATGTDEAASGETGGTSGGEAAGGEGDGGAGGDGGDGGGGD
jgi:uncharacterized membrane protein YgcG